MWRSMLVVAAVQALVVPPARFGRKRAVLMAGDDSWAAALKESSGAFESESLKRFSAKAGAGSPADTARIRNEALLAWMAANGVWVSEKSGWMSPPHSLALATSTRDENEGEESGRGLLARRAVTQETCLVKMSLKLCMTKMRALEAPELKNYVDKDTNEFIAIALLLILERFKGASSKWAEYVAVLPEDAAEIGSTFTWTDAQLAFLDGSPVLGSTLSMQKKLRAEHALATVGLDQDVFSFEAWEWAFANLFSRAIRMVSKQHGGELLALVPYVDFINHSPFSSTYVSIDDADSPMPWEGPIDDEVVIYADRAYRQYEQIFISYGPRPNAELLLLYGFALDRNPFNSVALVVGANAGEDPLFEEKKNFALAVGRDIESTAFPLYADRFPDELLQFLRLACLTPEDLKGKRLADGDFSYILSTTNELAVLAAIGAACEAALLRYGAPDDPEQYAFDRIRRMAARLILTEQRILQKTILACDRKSNEISSPVKFAANVGAAVASKK
ncbi:hypothetical protein M885DRAFT_537049 [Pelagophyceae sp. CCMP2097]|nr:hypothetical protein M885DRAFT_537049 [Pelagophyceae sp. CCMP2097]